MRDWVVTCVAAASLGPVWGCGPEFELDALPERPVDAARIEGIWEGTIEPIDLRIVIHVSNAGDQLTGTLDSPDQSAFGIAIDDVRFDGRRFALAIENLGATYRGQLGAAGALAGEWDQGVALDLELVKVDAPTPRVRAQTPRPPFLYREVEVVFGGGAPGVELAGTLTIPPEETFPTLVLVTGSGPQDRNETLAGHEPFRVIADFLGRHGIATLRYDDRGFGQSTGDFGRATTRDFVSDAAAAVQFLQGRDDVDPTRIGVIGHSEGGWVAAALAARADDQGGAACSVMLAGPAVRGDAVHQLQTRLILEASPIPFFDSTIEQVGALHAALYEVAREPGTPEERRAKGIERYERGIAEFNFIARRLLRLDPENPALVDVILSPWFSSFIDYDPRPDLERARVPVLALFGSLDLQVPAQQSVPALERINGAMRSPRFEIQTFDGLNHLFQTATTGSPDEYGRIEETISPAVLERLARFTSERCVARASRTGAPAG